MIKFISCKQLLVSEFKTIYFMETPQIFNVICTVIVDHNYRQCIYSIVRCLVEQWMPRVAKEGQIKLIKVKPWKI